MNLTKDNKRDKTKKNVFIGLAVLVLSSLLCLLLVFMDKGEKKVPSSLPELTEEDKNKRKELYDRMFPELSEEDLKPVQDPHLELY